MSDGPHPESWAGLWRWARADRARFIRLQLLIVVAAGWVVGGLMLTVLHSGWGVLVIGGVVVFAWAVTYLARV